MQAYISDKLPRIIPVTCTCVQSNVTTSPHRDGEDLDELLEISDRFVALDGGRLSRAWPVADLTMDEIGLMMGGAHGLAVENAPA